MDCGIHYQRVQRNALWYFGFMSVKRVSIVLCHCAPHSAGRKVKYWTFKIRDWIVNIKIVENWKFVWEFSQLSCSGQTGTRVAWELMRVDKREFVWEFHVLVKREQELHESWWELTSESLYESFLNSHVLVKREQELHESWWEFTSESLYESFLNSHVLVKREQELHES